MAREIGAKRAPAGQAARQPGGPGRGVGRWRQTAAPPVDPELGLAIEDPAPGSRPQRARSGRPAGERGGALEDRLADDAVDLHRPAVSVRGGQAGAERVQLIVQALLGDLALGDQATAVAHRGGQRVADLVGDDAALPLPGQIGQGGAVTVVGLEPP